MNEDLKLQIHYQPKIDLKSNEVYGVEALARFKNWRDEILNTEAVLKNFKIEKMSLKILKIIKFLKRALIFL